jgi:hypothetical protein
MLRDFSCMCDDAVRIFAISAGGNEDVNYRCVASAASHVIGQCCLRYILLQSRCYRKVILQLSGRIEKCLLACVPWMHRDGRHARPEFWKDMVMRWSSSFIAPLAVVVLSTSLLNGPAASQTATGSGATLPAVTVVAPKQVARPHRPTHEANTTTSRISRRSVSAAERPARTVTPAPSAAPKGSVMARLAEIERTSSNCTDGCQTSFKYGNQPWNGCSASGDTFSPTCRNVRNFKSYDECTEHGLFIGWHRAAVWGYCTSLLAGNKFKVAELKRAGR